MIIVNISHILVIVPFSTCLPIPMFSLFYFISIGAQILIHISICGIELAIFGRLVIQCSPEHLNLTGLPLQLIDNFGNFTRLFRIDVLEGGDL